MKQYVSCKDIREHNFLHTFYKGPKGISKVITIEHGYNIVSTRRDNQGLRRPSLTL